MLECSPTYFEWDNIQRKKKFVLFCGRTCSRTAIEVCGKQYVVLYCLLFDCGCLGSE